MKINDLTQYLTEIHFVGPFPQGIQVLLVPLETALAEARLIEPKLTRDQLKSILRKDEIFVFNNLEEWVKFKTPLKK